MSETAAGNAALILLARLDSRRLPGKGLKDLGGRSVLGLAVERLARCIIVNDMILATTDRAVDDPLEEFAAQAGIACFRGDADDVAGRCLACCDAQALDWFIRICGDSPFADPAVVDAVARRFLEDRPDIATNVHPRAYPIGASAEAMHSDALRRTCRETQDLAYLEHVTLWAYEHPQDYHIENVAPPDDRYDGLSIAVDTPEDLEQARRLVATLSDPVVAPLDEIVRRLG